MQFNTRTHPLGDLQFNPAARRGDSEWRVLYLGCGDGGSGESSRPDTRNNPQRLDTLVGKILRIIPDLAEHQSTSTVSDNGRYRIPNDNPFVSTAGARKEIWASGFRNPHRLHWAIDPANPKNNRLIANSIGLRTWETVNIIQRGANYGYSLREGNEALKFDNNTTKRPEVDRIPRADRRPDPGGDDHADVSGGAVSAQARRRRRDRQRLLYQGKNIPALRGKYVFTRPLDRPPLVRRLPGDAGGRRWQSRHDGADARDRTCAGTIRTTRLMPASRSIPPMFPIAQAAYHFRGGKDPDLPGRATVSGDGRADAQLAVDAAGELYILTKTDGMIRA